MSDDVKPYPREELEAEVTKQLDGFPRFDSDDDVETFMRRLVATARAGLEDRASTGLGDVDAERISMCIRIAEAEGQIEEDERDRLIETVWTTVRLA